jgi:RNA polymerase sigma-70 factor (ECF subfamily)
MTTESANEITSLLIDWSNGDKSALDRLFPIVEHELHRLAHSYMRRDNPDHTLQTTALVNEAYLRLVDQRQQNWSSRSHFYGVAAQLMRHILVDHARKRAAKKRSGGAAVTFDEGIAYTAERAGELVALDDALVGLAAFDERKAKIVELRFFGGLTIDETAQALGMSTATVERETRLAQMWLAREMKGERPA